MMDSSSVSVEEGNYQILQAGIKKSADSLAVMLNKRVEVKDLKYQSTQNRTINGFNFNSKSNTLMLKTELAGMLSGIHYFLLDQEEAKTIYENCMDEEIDSQNSSESKTIFLEYLKEIENVIAAATISEIADYFDLLK